MAKKIFFEAIIAIINGKIILRAINILYRNKDILYFTVKNFRESANAVPTRTNCASAFPTMRKSQKSTLTKCNVKDSFWAFPLNDPGVYRHQVSMIHCIWSCLSLKAMLHFQGSGGSDCVYNKILLSFYQMGSIIRFKLKLNFSRS